MCSLCVQIICFVMGKGFNPHHVFVYVHHVRLGQCRNPTLAKCEDETHTSQSWGFGVLRDSQIFKVR
jgi:hypothetical protein